MKSLEQQWEDGTLGRDERYVQKFADSSQDLDEMLGSKMISIRLSKAMLQDLKNIAEINGLGYQPLIKQILDRFIEGEKRAIANEQIARELKKIKEQKEEKKIA